eukprot:6351251-Prymnesium_polylepis.1
MCHVTPVHLFLHKRVSCDSRHDSRPRSGFRLWPRSEGQTVVTLGRPCSQHSSTQLCLRHDDPSAQLRRSRHRLHRFGVCLRAARRRRRRPSPHPVTPGGEDASPGHAGEL